MIDICIIDSCINEVEKEVLVNFAWVTRPERPKGVIIYQAGPKGPKGRYLEVGPEGLLGF